MQFKNTYKHFKKHKVRQDAVRTFAKKQKSNNLIYLQESDKRQTDSTVNLANLTEVDSFLKEKRKRLEVYEMVK